MTKQTDVAATPLQPIVPRLLLPIDPYYQDDCITIYNADCRDVLRYVDVPDLVLSDPPYSDAYVEEFGYQEELIHWIGTIPCRQLVFWSATASFPLSWTAVHVWDKKVGCGSQYERIFERNGGKECKVFSKYFVNSTVAASFTGDVFTGHKTQKPLALMRELLARVPDAKTVLDPFAGSGSTLAACKIEGRKAIGIERDEKWCQKAADRLRQNMLF